MVNRNDSLSNIEKNYLKFALKNEATQTLTSLEMSEDNYAVVWERLRDRYEDNNERINHHLKSLTGLLSMSADLASVLQLIDNFSNIFSNV